MAAPRLPNDTERHAIYGMTGSGKTVFALWCLSLRDFDKKPWIIVDFKRDTIIRQIPRLKEIGVTDKLPKHPGLYVVRPLPSDSKDGTITDFLYRVWQKEYTGLLLDEGYMISRFDTGLQAVLTQGRSKHIPMICLSQKPTWISPFIHSESEFKSVFFLQMPRDIDTVSEWLPGGDPRGLPPHHSYWYQVATRDFRTLGPCPNESQVLNTFDDRIVPRRWRL